MTQHQNSSPIIFPNSPSSHLPPFVKLPGPMVELHEVDKIYHLGATIVNALKGVSFQVPKGQVVFIMGPSGSGKTTLLNLIGGIDTLSHGKIHIQGENIANYSPSKLTQYRRRTLSFVFQFYSLIPTLTAKENVELTMELMKIPKKTISQLAEKYLSMVDLLDRKDNFPSQLSGGERQRVAIARALAKQPHIMLVDEPTGQLDQETGIKIVQSIHQIAKQENITVILVTHDPEIKIYADRVIQLRSGEIVSDELIDR